MEKITRLQLAESVALEIRERLARGELKGRLPGVRALSVALGVSAPTLCQALHLLAEEGLVTGRERQRWEVIGSQPHTRPKDGKRASEGRQAGRAGSHRPKRGRLLFLSSSSMSSERYVEVVFFGHLLDMLGKKGWELVHRVVDFPTAIQPRRAWNELVELEKIDALVVLEGSPAVGKWAAELGLRCLFVGGDPGTRRLPTLLVRVERMLEGALTRLHESGHERVLVPLWGRMPAMVSRLRRAADDVAKAIGMRPDAVVITESRYSSPDVVLSLLRKEWKKRVPDAIVLMDCREFFAASSLFSELGVRIPADLSVIILSDDINLEWHVPPISHYEIPAKVVARMTVDWVTQGKRKPRGPEARVKEVAARWREGRSIRKRN